MRRELIVKTRSLVGSSDLTLLAPIRIGLIPSLESVTYKTRIKRVLRTLNAGRTSSHEYSLLRAFSDAVDRVGMIHSVRVAIVEPDQLLLSVTFDGGWESYLRVLWQKVGTLLDVIFCNTGGYVSAWGHTFEEWADWVRAVQIETDFFYGMPGLTVEDVRYLRNEEFLHRHSPGGNATDLLATRQAVQSAEKMTWSLVGSKQIVLPEVGRQGLRALALIYRLAGLYLPGTTDGDFLHRAARDILLEFVQLDKRGDLEEVIKLAPFERFAEQLDWLRREVPPRKIPELGKQTPRPDDPTQVQGGIISAFPEEITHGCLLLIAFKCKQGTAKFLDALTARVTHDGKVVGKDEPTMNIAFTCEGLRAIGLSEAQIDLFPQEFREGMEARASVLGDVRRNHPRRWQLPQRNWGRASAEPVSVVELSTVHAVVELRIVAGPASTGETLDKDDPLHAYVTTLFSGHDEVELLSVQPMVRYVNDAGRPREHFGFADAESNPVFDPGKNGVIYTRNQVQLGEFLWGYSNEAEAPQDPDAACDPDFARERRNWLHNGSFLVVRKLSQDVGALDEAMEAASTSTGLDKHDILAKMMGRRLDGTALAADPGTGNDFNYAGESPPGSLCPFHAHIRRANPRQAEDPSLPAPPPGKRTPRLMRRGMSYGPVYNRNDPTSREQARGMVFMAYNASIAEQFEVVQRWISGGNSAGGYSGQSDPFLGVAPNGQRKYFRFEHEKKVYQIALDGADNPDDPLAGYRPFVRLEWGAYLFTPSIKVLNKMAEVARLRADAPEQAVWSSSAGRWRIQELLALERSQGAEQASVAWKALLEDPEAQSRFESAGVWAAIREHCGGVLRTPYGVIVADHGYIKQVLANQGGLYSMCRHNDRMKQSIGEIYLGLDDHGEGCPYREQSTAINDAILNLKKDETFEHARAAAADALRALIDHEKELATLSPDLHWELSVDLKEVIEKALEAICRQWFGLPAEPCEIRTGGARWDWKYGDPPYYPGHFTAPSRYIFQPRPGQSVEAFGSLYGQALRRAFADLIKRQRDASSKPPVLDADAPLAKAILSTFPRRDAGDTAADDLAARNMVGALMGFLPTVDGNLRQSINEWLRDGSFWSLRTALADCDPATPFANAEKLIESPLKKTMQLRPAPELIWRTATGHGQIGDEPVRPGDRVVLALVSATQQSLEASRPGDNPEIYPIFGGDRHETVHPTHACPGYQAAMGAMLGVISALLEIKEATRPSLAPLALTLDGDLPLADRPAESELEAKHNRLLFALATKGVHAFDLLDIQGGTAPGNRVGVGHTLVATGDSWMCYRKYGFTGPEQNIAAYLATYGFQVKQIESALGAREYDFYKSEGRDAPPLACKKNEMDSVRIGALVDAVKKMSDEAKPTAILLSAAGNDVVQERLMPLLNQMAAGLPHLNEQVVCDMVDGVMRCWLELILDRVSAECVTAPGVPIPIFIHGYDYPVPDGRYVLKGDSYKAWSWLYPSFVEKGYMSPSSQAYPVEGVGIMEMLIKRLNAMQKDVAALDRFKGHVFHVDLTGTLSNAEADYTKYWDNELHPTVPGFIRLTEKFAGALFENIPALKARSQGGGLL